MWFRRYWRLLIGGIGGGSILAFLLLFFREVIVEVVVQIFANFLPGVGTYIVSPQTIVLWPILVLFLVLLGVGGVGLNILRRAVQFGRHLAELADLHTKMLAILAEWRSNPDGQTGIEPLLHRFLYEATEMFHKDIYRASITRPDPAEPDVLRLWIAPDHSSRSKESRRFYIGNDDNRKSERGVIGETYLDGNMRLARFSEQGSETKIEVWTVIYLKDERKWVLRPDDKDKSYQVLGIASRTRRYQSIVTIPIEATSGASNKPTRFGVLCFDGTATSSFDGPGEYERLFALGTTLAATLILYEQLFPPLPDTKGT